LGCTVFSFNPRTYIRRAIFELDAIPLAPRQKPDGLSTHEPHLLQIHDDTVGVGFGPQESLQLCQLIHIDSTAQGKDHDFLVSRLMNPQRHQSDALAGMMTSLQLQIIA